MGDLSTVIQHVTVRLGCDCWMLSPCFVPSWFRFWLCAYSKVTLCKLLTFFGTFWGIIVNPPWVVAVKRTIKHVKHLRAWPSGKSMSVIAVLRVFSDCSRR